MYMQLWNQAILMILVKVNVSKITQWSCSLYTVWMKNRKKGYFRLATSLPKQFSLKTKFLIAIV